MTPPRPPRFLLSRHAVALLLALWLWLASVTLCLARALATL